MLWMKKVNKKIYSWYLMLEILRSLFWNHFVKKCWSTVNLICESFLQLTLGLQGSFLVRWWQLHCVDPQCTWWVSPSKPFVEIVIIILLNGKSSLFLFGTTSYIYMPALPDTAQISQYAVWSTNLSHKIEFGAFFALHSFFLYKNVVFPAQA